MKTGKIYKITNSVNGKEYVGCTIYDIKKRIDEHFYRCLKTDCSTKFCNSVRKYGTENFEVNLIEECDLSVIYEREKFYIEKYNTYYCGLNTTFGGEGCLGYKHSEEIKKKISKNTKNGNSHKNKTYEDLYGDRAEDERNKRKLSVKKGWENLTNEERLKRKENIRKKTQAKSKINIEIIKDIKNKISEGYSNKQLSEIYPELRKNLFGEIRRNVRWKKI
jgi:group I intron endonuclease